MIGLWLYPIGRVAIKALPPPGYPAICKDHYRVSCLFPSYTEQVVFFHVELRRAGSRGWEPMAERELFPMKPFGYRSRFDRMMARWGHKRAAVRQHFVDWLVARDRELNPDLAPVTHVRFLSTVRPILREQPPTGRWQKPERAPRGRERVSIVATHRPGAASGGAP